MTRVFLCILIPVFLFGATLSSKAVAENAAVDEDKVREIGYMLRCPICQGLAVAESHSEISENMKDKIRELLAQGKSDDEIFQYFEERYGEWILREPRKTGWNLLLWIVPSLSLVLAFSGMGFYLYRKKRRMEDEKTVTAPVLSDEDEALIAQDMENLEKSF